MVDPSAADDGLCDRFIRTSAAVHSSDSPPAPPLSLRLIMRLRPLLLVLRTSLDFVIVTPLAGFVFMAAA